MADVHSSLSWTQSDALAEVVSAESCHIVLEPSPPDYVEKISRYLESSVGQGEQDKVCHEPAEAESDSGDSLFITQKPVPEAVRSASPGRYNLRKHPIFLSEESDGDSSSSHGESRTAKRSKRQKCILPKYSFPFLSEKKWKPTSTLLPARQNTSLHNYMMGGFFKCVRELWQGYERGDDVESSLPTVDVDGDYISPLSEEEEEGSEVEDIKVVERKHFVATLKAKSRHAWCNQLKQKKKKSGDARQKPSQGAKASISRATPLSLGTVSADDGQSSCGVLVKRKRETREIKRGLTQGKKKIVFQQKAREEELCDDSDATVCELPIPGQYVQNDREASTTVTEPQTDVFHTDDLSQTAQAEDEPESQSLLRGLPDLIRDTNNDSVCSETGVKKRKKKKKDRDHESVEEEKSQEEPQGVHAAAEDTPSLSQDNRAEPLASQTSDELEFNERNCIISQDDTILRQEERDIPDSKQKKKKRKKTAAKNVGQEVDGNLELDVRVEDSVFSASCNVDNSGKKKKSKRSGEDVEQLQSSAVAEPLNDDAEIQMKKKKRKKEGKIVVAQECEGEEESNRTSDLPPMSTGQLEESGDCLEKNSAETLESRYVKRKKKKNKHQSSNDATKDGEEVVDVNFSNDALTLEESTGMSLKKKKRKKKKTILEGVDIFGIPEENEKAEDVDNTQKTKEGLEDQNAELVTKKKKKKKKKMTKRSISNISEDSVAQSNDSVSARKKEKKRTSSFLIADAEENDAQTHGKQNSQSHVWGAEKPAVSTEVESAGNVAESNSGVRKKKRRRKVTVELDSVEKDHKLDFVEPNETRQSALPETTDAGVKRKKKRMANESEFVVAPVERLESAADAGHLPTYEAVVLKKKKKKKKCKDEPLHVIQESAPAATEDDESGQSSLNACSLVSHKKRGKHLTSPSVAKGKYGHSASSTSDQATKETLNMVEHASPSLETPGNQALHHMSDKKKMKSNDNVLVKGNSITKSVELENKKKERNKQSTGPSIMSSSPVLLETSLSKSEMSSLDRITKNGHMKVRRRLLNPSEDFLTDY
ncbi:phoenix [Dicentrarchus labrax]|uniref:phoenix n=1 Tax=Dicentrarchus labrax TaxID=13489 RepID=UPI0021F6755D|nr:phoenix [Dicentrarchus labrax]